MLAIGVVAVVHLVVAYRGAPAEKQTLAGITAIGAPNLVFLAALVWLALRVRHGRRLTEALAVVALYGLMGAVVIGGLAHAGRYEGGPTLVLVQGLLAAAVLHALYALWRAHGHRPS